MEQLRNNIYRLYRAYEKKDNELEKSLKKQEEIYFSLIKVLMNSIDAKDFYTKGHCERVMGYSLAIGQALGLNKQELKTLKYGSILHDVGKIGISENILNKQDKYTDQEYDIMKMHTEIGFNIIKDVDMLRNANKIIYQHHERYDGRGYPNGLKGEEIYYLARIVSITDAYDAMTTIRSYRKMPLTEEQAIKELRSGASYQFDPFIVEIFIDLLKEKSSLMMIAP